MEVVVRTKAFLVFFESVINLCLILEKKTTWEDRGFNSDSDTAE